MFCGVRVLFVAGGLVFVAMFSTFHLSIKIRIDSNFYELHVLAFCCCGGGGGMEDNTTSVCLIETLLYYSRQSLRFGKRKRN